MKKLIKIIKSMRIQIKLISIIIFLTLSLESHSQIINWEKCYGGSYSDEGNSIIINKKGNLVTIGTATSNDFDVTTSFGSEDFWVCEIDTNGNLIREKSFGLAFVDEGIKIIQTFDGGYLLGGITDYPAGACHGQHDFRVYKIDSLWNLEWMKCFGSSRNDELTAILQTNDSGFVICGHTFGDDGDIPFHYGSLSDADIFLVKIGQYGSFEWSKILGGTSNELSCDIKQSSVGNLYLTGSTGSFDNDLPAIRYGGYCVFKLDSVGNIIWVKTYGSTNISDRSYQMILNQDESYYIIGQTAGNDGDVSGLNGALDAWLFKADSNGNLIWQKCIGTGGLEWGQTMSKTGDGGLIIGAVSAGGDSVIQNYIFGPDCWIVKLDSNGNHEWNKIYGGSENDEVAGIVQLSEHKYVFLASSRSIDYDVTSNHGTNYDKWVVNIGDPFVGVPENNNSYTDIELKIINEELFVRYTSKTNFKDKAVITDVLGRIIYSKSIQPAIGPNYLSVKIPFLHGLYVIRIGSVQKKFMH